ncbi:XS domain-containing protein [Artemisia annua]|uniref:XS domain-containing protein n=1 Tax=Artemisia annua TaxID=35608 RepID=A0A2U1PR49_ARTAN|nr:XS domain-containing protein [Artemisia annua]
MCEMSYQRGGGQSNKGKNVATSSNFDVDQLNQGVQDVNLGSNEDGGWATYSKKNKNKAGNGTGSNQWASQNPKANPWGQSDPYRTSGRGNVNVRPPNNARATQMGGRGGFNNQPMNRNYGNNYNPALNSIRPPLQGGWDRKRVNALFPQPASSPKSHEERKKNKWFAEFFTTLDKLTVDEISEPDRQWHCPACKNGPGAIDWYKSLQYLISHAKRIGSKRVKLHREFAEVLEEELRIKGATVVPAGESFGQWEGPNETVKDKEIVWPPMVIIMNTLLEQDENDKWIGMGNPELLDYFPNFAAVKARHSYGPKGHRGMSLLIFESSAVGYTEAERLSKHFEQQGAHRDAWDYRPALFLPGGKRRLYGYMATKNDMDIFNQHCQGKSKVKFEMVSYLENYVNQLKQMKEDNQLLNFYKDKSAKDARHAKAMEESNVLLSKKLRESEVQYRVVRERTESLHKQNQEEMDSQEQHYNDLLKGFQEARNREEDHFDKLMQEERRRVDQTFSDADPQKRDEKFEEMKVFEEEREKLMSLHDKKMAELQNKYLKDKVELEQGFNADLTRLRDKYAPKA